MTGAAPGCRSPDAVGSLPTLKPVSTPRQVIREVLSFMAVGGLSTLVSFTIFNFLAHGLYLTSHPWLGAHPITSFILANLAGMVVSYRLSRYWTFRHRPPVHADGGRLAFFAINLATLPLAIGCLWFSRNVLHLTDPIADNLAGNVIGQLMGQAARFYLFRTYVFRKPVSIAEATHRPEPTHRSTAADTPS